MDAGPDQGGAEHASTQAPPHQSLSGPLTSQALAAIEDEGELNNMLDKAVDFEERRMIRAALRELLKQKRERREKERGSRQQDLRQQGLSKAGTEGAGMTPGGQARPINQQKITHKGTTQSQFSGPGTAGSVVNHPSVAPAPCPPASAAPNLKTVKQMLLDWCRAKTEPYEGVDIQNFSSSWSDGIAFCALVHRFFPDAFEYSILNPNKRKDNFELAFSTAERLADCPPLLDVDDLLRMKEPNWKCVYTYLQEFYRCLVKKGLVKTKKKALA